ncbi:MAG: hypothetical protein HY931_02875 [Candidatus Falkowbacteria bacterium]|nr:MAG: hypothetical protein HY931_02875 [Candidatus Falkowbacteria bacterium]
MVGQIILGAIMIAAGAGAVIKTEWIINNFGRMAWFEEKLGSEGGSRLGYKLIGVVVLAIGIIVMTGSGDDFMRWLLSPIIKYSLPK